MRDRRDTRQGRQDLERWFSLRAEAIGAGELGVPVSVEDFHFLLRNGGQLTQEDVPYAGGDCYISRLEIRVESERKVYRFKTLTTSIGEFYVPF